MKTKDKLGVIRYLVMTAKSIDDETKDTLMEFLSNLDPKQVQGWILDNYCENNDIPSYDIHSVQDHLDSKHRSNKY